MAEPVTLHGAHRCRGLLSERTFSFGGGGQGLRTFLTSLTAMQHHCFADHLLDVGHSGGGRGWGSRICSLTHMFYSVAWALEAR